LNPSANNIQSNDELENKQNASNNQTHEPIIQHAIEKEWMIPDIEYLELRFFYEEKQLGRREYGKLRESEIKYELNKLG